MQIGPVIITHSWTTADISELLACHDRAAQQGAAMLKAYLRVCVCVCGASAGR